MNNKFLRDNIEKKRKIYFELILFISALGMFVLSTVNLTSYFIENKKQDVEFVELEKRITKLAEDDVDITKFEEVPRILVEYEELYKRNNDLFGWIKIEDTSLSYPVMHTPTNPEYYLYRNFDGDNSKKGVPFLDARCSIDSKNYIVYGHHMKDGTMFMPLLYYADKQFWDEHPIIQFDTLYEKGTYTVIAAFYSRAYYKEEKGVFRYYEYTDLTNPTLFYEYVEQVEISALYDTNYTAVYGDQLLTLSTCSYHTDNGRFVVVARKN